MEITNYKTMEKELLKLGFYVDGVLEEAERHERECGDNYGRGDFDYELGRVGGRIKLIYFSLEKPAIVQLSNDAGDTVELNRNDPKIDELLDEGYDFDCEISEPVYKMSL